MRSSILLSTACLYALMFEKVVDDQCKHNVKSSEVFGHGRIHNVVLLFLSTCHQIGCSLCSSLISTNIFHICVPLKPGSNGKPAHASLYVRFFL